MATLWRMLRRRTFDIVHTYTAKAGVLGRVTARAAGVKVVAHTAFSFPHLDMPDKAWLYGPLEPWFDQTWRPGEFEPVD